MHHSNIQGLEIIFPVRTEYLGVITENQSLMVNAHSVLFLNEGNTVMKVKGKQPVNPDGDYLIIGAYGDFRAFVKDRYNLEFVTEGVENPINKVHVFIEIAEGFPYPTNTL